MTKILLVATVQSHICQFHKALVYMLREHGNIEIHVAAKNNLDEKNGLKLDFVDKVFDVPFERSPFNAKNIEASIQLNQIISQGNYDIIHCNTPVGGILTRMIAKKARKNGTRIIYTAHGFHFYKGAPKKNWIFYYPVEKYFSRKTDVLITINEEDYKLAKEKFYCQVEHIHGVGVDENRYRPANENEKNRLREKLELHGKLILCVGELLPNKNQAMAIRAMNQVVKKVPDAKLLIAGNGPEKNNLELLISKFGLYKNVKMLGYCTNLEEYQRICSLSISCSKREGLGINLIEAMLSGNSVVATKNRGHNELVQDGVNGYLVEQDNIKELSEKIIEILTDDQKARKFVKNGNAIAQKYTYDVVKEELRRIYFG